MQSSVLCYNLLQKETRSQILGLAESSFSQSLLDYWANSLQESLQINWLFVFKELDTSLHLFPRWRKWQACHFIFILILTQIRWDFYSGQLSEEADDATHKFQLFILRAFKEEKQHTLIMLVFKKQNQLRSTVTNSMQTLFWKAPQYTAPQDTSEGTNPLLRLYLDTQRFVYKKQRTYI